MLQEFVPRKKSVSGKENHIPQGVIFGFLRKKIAAAAAFSKEIFSHKKMGNFFRDFLTQFRGNVINSGESTVGLKIEKKFFE